MESLIHPSFGTGTDRPVYLFNELTAEQQQKAIEYNKRETVGYTNPETEAIEDAMNETYIFIDGKLYFESPDWSKNHRNVLID